LIELIMFPDLYYCITAYNEEGNILNCLASLAAQDLKANIETIVCLNGCTDRTERILLKAAVLYPLLNIQVIHSNRGKSFAQNAIFRNVKNKDVPLVFIDADVTLDTKCINILYKELCALRQLIIAGAWPTPYSPRFITNWERFLFKVLHIRAFYPEAEVSINNVSNYKNYVKERPQPNMSIRRELRSKIYFHGRTFMIRNANYFCLPEDANVADDTYLPNMIHTKYGPGTIRTRYDAFVYYKPYLSIKEHYKTYRRVYINLYYLDIVFKDFKHSRIMEKTKLDWNFIFLQGFSIVNIFILYSLIKKMEFFFYRILPKKPILEIWRYNKK